MTALDLTAVAQRVEALACAAGDGLLEYRDRLTRSDAEFKGRRDLVTEADREAERVVVAGLLESYPEHAILAEEGVLTPAGVPSRDSDWLWMVDPLDGTTNFVHGIPLFCVAISLSFRGEVVVGVVHAPVLGDTYVGSRGNGATRNGEAMTVSSTAEVGHALLATGLSYHRNEPGYDDNTQRISRIIPLCRDLRRLGSAQLDLCLTAAGTLDGYWEMHLAPHDVGAGSLLVQEAGGVVTDLAGGDDWVADGHLLASNPALHPQLMALLGGAP